MEAKYKWHDLTVRKVRSDIGHWHSIHYNARRIRDDFVSIEGVEVSETCETHFMQKLREMLTESINAVKKSYPDKKCICGELIPRDATSGSDCFRCGHCFCVAAKKTEKSNDDDEV